MKKKTFLFRKASYKKSILKIKPVANKLCLVVNKNNIVSNKLLECCRVTVSRLTRNGIKKWNTQNYKNNLFSFSDTLDNSNDIYFKQKNIFSFFKSNMVSFFRIRSSILRKYKKKEKKKKTKKKISTGFVKQNKKQKDIYNKIINQKINFKINNFLNLPMFRRSNKSRMGKGKSKVSTHVKFLSKNEILFLFNNLDKKKQQLIKKQLNYKTNLNVSFFSNK